MRLSLEEEGRMAERLCEVRVSLYSLRGAREAAKRAKVSKRSVDRIRAAIRSLEGAERHAELAPQRRERQLKTNAGGGDAGR